MVLPDVLGLIPAPIADEQDLSPDSYSKVPILYGLPPLRPVLLSWSPPYLHYPLVGSGLLSYFLCTKWDCARLWEAAFRSTKLGPSLSLPPNI